MTDDAMRLFRTILDHLPESQGVHSLIKDAQTSRAYHPWGDQHKDPEKDCEDKLYWDSIKWYEDYDDIDFIETFLSDCIPEEDYRLVRVGEESSDVEERGDYWDSEIFVERNISW